MLSPIQKNISQAVPYLAGRAQRPAMVAVREDAAPAPELAIDGLGESDGEALNPSSEGARVVRLDQEMHVIPLNRVVREAKAGPGRAGEAAPDSGEQAGAAQRWQPGHDPEGYVDRVMLVVRRPRSVRHARPRAGGLAPGTGAAAAPGTESERGLSRTKAHLD